MKIFPTFVLLLLGINAQSNPLHLKINGESSWSAPSLVLTIAHERVAGFFFMAHQNVHPNHKHGLSTTRVYSIWHSMIRRCENKSDEAYANYGGRGIKVCDEWKDIRIFYSWALSSGYSSKLTIERINHNGNYEPSNCTWIPKAKQAANKRNNNLITANGETHYIQYWADRIGITTSSIRTRLKRGWSEEEAVTLPPDLHRKRRIWTSTPKWRGLKGKDNSRHIIVEQLDLNGNVLNTFYGVNEASRKTGVVRSNIMACAKGINKTAHGFMWRYKDKT